MADIIWSENREMKRDFNQWLGTFRDSISDYGYYVDFEKVYGKVDKIKVELCLLNSLVGSKNIEADFNNLLERYPEILKCIPILLAVRKQEIYCQDLKGGYLYNFDPEKLQTRDKDNASKREKYAYFMEKTGLFGLLREHIIKDLVDYVTGVETGLDSNGRKNRGGHLMENLVQRYIEEAGFVKGKTYFKEMQIEEINSKWGIELSAISNGGKVKKRLDFVVEGPSGMIYGIETNFYASGGSKLNETARSYKTLALGSDTIKNFAFVWITDGKGWRSAQNNLEETFDVMENIYNIKDLENGIAAKVFK